jgi:biotin operon repressor
LSSRTLLRMLDLLVDGAVHSVDELRMCANDDMCVDGTVRSHVCRLRRLGLRVVSVRGAGYQLVELLKSSNGS